VGEDLRATEPVAPDAGVIEWTYRVPLLTSRFMLWDFARVIVLSALLMYVAVAFVGWLAEGELVLLPPQVFVIVGGVMFMLLAIAALLLGNHVTMTFAVGPEGVTYASGSRERKWNRAAVVLGVLAGSASTAGAGLLSASREQGGWGWAEIHAARYFPGQRVISLRNTWRTVLRLHCTAAEYERVRAIVAAGLERGAAARAEGASVAPPSRRPLREYLRAVLVPVVAAVLVTAWPWLQYEDGMRVLVFVPVLLIGAWLLPAGGLSRVLAGFSLVPMLAVMYFTVREMSAALPGLLPGERAYGWELDTGLLAVTLVAEVVLLALALGRLFAPGARMEVDD